MQTETPTAALTLDERPAHPRRILWIDVAKGIAMLLVFYGHLGGAGDNPWFPNLTGSIWVVYLFHMPLFFMLSGLTFNPNKDFRTFFISRVKRLVIPYFFFSIYALGKILLLTIAPSVVAGFHAGSMGTPLAELGNIFLGNTNGLWFFLALFWGELALYGVHHLTKAAPHRILVLAIIVAISGCAWFTVSLLSVYQYVPFQLLHATEAIAFVGLGWMLAPRLKDLPRRSSSIFCAVTMVAFIAFGLLIRYTPAPHAITWTIAPAVLLRLCAATFGSLMVIFLTQLMAPWRWLTYIGRNTMIFYGLNGLSMAIARKAVFMLVPVSLVAAHLALQIAIGFVVITVACLVCAAATPIINRWCWWGIGLPDPPHAQHAAKLDAQSKS